MPSIDWLGVPATTCLDIASQRPGPSAQTAQTNAPRGELVGHQVFDMFETHHMFGTTKIRLAKFHVSSLPLQNIIFLNHDLGWKYEVDRC